MTYSFPCVDISNAGRMAGFKKESGTRSGLLWEVERLLNECGDDLPQVLLMENVPNVICDRNVTDFGKWVSFLERKGYSNYIEIINAKDVGYPNPIPQRRERCFMVSILGEYLYYFPKKQPLKATLKDLLEDDVGEKYLLSKSMLKHIVSADDKYKVNPNNLVVNRKIACTKTTREGYTRADCSDFIATKDDRDNIPLGSLFVKEATAKGYAEAELGDSVDLGFPKSNTRRGRVGKQIAQTLMTSCDQGVVVEYLGKLGLRKLTPRECWRLMGFSDDDYDKASKVTSECQLYKQAGNSIVVNVLSAIFKEML